MALLTRAAAAGEAQFAASRAGDALGQVGDNLGSCGTGSCSEWATMRDEQGRQVDAQQTQGRVAMIIDAIGRPVTKVILDRGDNVILDFGDIITHQAVQQAFEAGMLDTLLASVHRATVGFPLDDLKAKQPGSATVEKASGGSAVLEELEQQDGGGPQQREATAEAQRLEGRPGTRDPRTRPVGSRRGAR